MIPGTFDYHAPASVEEAIALLSEHGDSAKILAGGQSLIPAMRYRLAVPGVLVDINRLKGLDYIKERDDHLAIGAMTREASLDETALLSAYPLLKDTAVVIADPLIRNRATVGGNLAHSDPANDHPATFLAYNATLIARGPEGERAIAIDDFFTGLFENALAADELLIELRVPKAKPYSSGAYFKLERKVGDYAISAVAVQLTLADDRIVEARVGLTNVSPVPMRAKNAESALTGQKISEEVLEAVGQAAARECEPSGDLRGDVAYKRDVTRILLKRAVKMAVARAKGVDQ